MAVISWADVTAHAATMSTVHATAQTDILAHVNVLLNVAHFGGEDAPKTRLARILLACHFGQMNLNSLSGAAGAVVSKKLGDMSVEFGDPSSTAASSSSSPYNSTLYGKQYLTIVRNTSARAGTVL